MTYRPKPSVRQEEIDVDIKVSKKIDEILGSIKQVGSMYVEPGDVVLVQVDDSADAKTVQNLQKLLTQVFKDNQGVFVTDAIQFKIMKRSDTVSDSEDLKSVKQELERIKARLLGLESFVSKRD